MNIIKIKRLNIQVYHHIGCNAQNYELLYIHKIKSLFFFVFLQK